MCPQGSTVAFRKNKEWKGGKAPIADKTREEIVKEVEERVKTMIKSLLETLMKEERELYLEEHPTKANGYYTRDLLTLAGPVEDLRVPRVREGDFHPKILPYRRRTSLELSEAILALYACGVSPRTIPRFLESVYGAFYSPQSISRLTQVVEEEVRAWRTRPLDEEYYAVFLDGTFLSLRRGGSAKEPVDLALGIGPPKMVARWETKASGLLVFLRHPQPIRR